MSSEDGVVDLGEKAGLKYIPLFSPTPKHKERQPSSPTFPSLSFTEEENSRFQLRWENGYDLKHDQRYNDWVKIHHPDSPKSVGLDLTPFPGYSSDEEPAASSGTHSPTSTGTGISEPSPASVLSNFLVVPKAPAKLKKNPSGVVRVLTSKKNMELLEAKEKKKRELEEEKKKRKEERERKAREREQQKREKERIRQDKKKKKTACGQTQGNSL